MPLQILTQMITSTRNGCSIIDSDDEISSQNGNKSDEKKKKTSKPLFKAAIFGIREGYFYSYIWGLDWNGFLIYDRRRLPVCICCI